MNRIFTNAAYSNGVILFFLQKDSEFK